MALGETRGPFTWKTHYAKRVRLDGNRAIAHN